MASEVRSTEENRQALALTGPRHNPTYIVGTDEFQTEQGVDLHGQIPYARTKAPGETVKKLFLLLTVTMQPLFDQD